MEGGGWGAADWEGVGGGRGVVISGRGGRVVVMGGRGGRGVQGRWWTYSIVGKHLRFFFSLSPNFRSWRKVTEARRVRRYFTKYILPLKINE